MILRERKRNRLKKFDYSQSGWYFVTVCAKNRVEYFGKVIDRKIVLNRYGEIIKNTWFNLPHHYRNCLLDEFILMQDHVHGIIIIKYVGNGLKPFPTKYSLSEIIRGFKTFSSRSIHQLGSNSFRWQKSFYDHIIRNEQSLWRIRQYIRDNPKHWEDGSNIIENVDW